jgi:hypothetical protein
MDRRTERFQPQFEDESNEKQITAGAQIDIHVFNIVVTYESGCPSYHVAEHDSFTAYKSASAGTYRVSCRVEGHDKRDICVNAH